MARSRDRSKNRRLPDSDAELCRRVPVTRRDFKRAGTAHQEEKRTGRRVRVGRAKMTDPPARDLNAPASLTHPAPGDVRNQIAETVKMNDVAGHMTIGAPLRSNRGQPHRITDGAAERVGAMPRAACAAAGAKMSRP